MRVVTIMTLAALLTAGCGGGGSAGVDVAVAADAGSESPADVADDATEPDPDDATSDVVPTEVAEVDVGAEPPAPLADPSAPGPYAVGLARVEWHDAERDRTLLVDIWYPAVHPDLASGWTYPLDVAEDINLGELPSPLGVEPDAPADLSGAPYPVILFSHGNNGMRYQNLFQCEHLASHGYVVASPDHTGNTIIEGVLGQDPWLTEHLPVVRPDDIRFVLDEVLRQGTGDGLLGGLPDGDRVGATGHSYGGYTVLVLGGAGLDLDIIRGPCADNPSSFGCELASEHPDADRFLDQRDPRILAVAPLTPGFFELIGVDGIAEMDVPVLVGGATADSVTPYEEEHLPVYEAAPGPRYLLKIETAGHFSYSATCDLLDVLDPELAQSFPVALGDGCSDDNVSDEVVKAAINTYTTAFFQRYVRGDERAAAWLEAGPGAHETVELLADP